VAKYRFVTWAGAHATDAAAVQGISELAGPAGRAGSLVTSYSYVVEAASAIPAGSSVAPSSDGTGRAVVASGGACGRAMTAAAAAGDLLTVVLQLGGSSVSEYENIAGAVYYAGEVSSVVTPTLIADGDLSTATDQVPLKWRVVINAEDDVAAAQALLDGTPNVIELLAGVQEQPLVYANDGVTPEVITSIYAVCVSTAVTRPADFGGGAYIITTTGSTLADALANMARVDFSSGLGATVARLVASQVYGTSSNYMQLSVSAGVTA
jgi:hypothetical protein